VADREAETERFAFGESPAAFTLSPRRPGNADDRKNNSPRRLSPRPGSRGPRRDFRITVGLREGWDDEGRVFDVSEAVRTARRWMKRRVEAGLPALSGMFRAAR